MSPVILFFGIFVVLGGAALLARHGYIFSLLRKHIDSVGLYFLAIVVRVALGAVLVIGAYASKFPVALQALGWLSISAALVLVGIGRTRFQSLIDWALGFPSPIRSLAGVLAMLFGGFLIYAVL